MNENGAGQTEEAIESNLSFSFYIWSWSVAHRFIYFSVHFYFVYQFYIMKINGIFPFYRKNDSLLSLNLYVIREITAVSLLNFVIQSIEQT